MRSLGEYAIMLGDVERDKVNKLHQLVGDFQEDLLGNRTLQNVLLNRGYGDMEEDARPKNIADLVGPSFHSRIASLALTYLNKITDLVTIPHLVVIKSPKIIIPGESDETIIETPDGYSFEKVEGLQEQWMKREDVRENVREYQEALEKAMNEYAMQFMLCRISHRRGDFIDPSWEEERSIQEKMDKAWDTKSYGVLDPAYYNMGERFFRGCQDPWEKLQEDAFGRFFVMSQEEIMAGLSRGD